MFSCEFCEISKNTFFTEHFLATVPSSNQVTNLKSLDFTWERIANLLGVFPEVVLCDIDFSGFFDVAFDPHISSIVRFVVDRVAKLVLFVSVAETDDSPATTLRRSSLISAPPSISYTGEQSS